MEEKGNFFRGNKMSFSQDKKIINNSRQKYIFNQFKYISNVIQNFIK